MDKMGTAIVVFGATGDLMRRKLAPALVHLFDKRELDEKSFVVCVGRREFTSDSYKEFLADENNSFLDKINRLPFYYFKYDFEKQKDLSSLKNFLDEIDRDANNRIFYLATNFNFFPDIVYSLKEAELDRSRGFTRVVFEKPFGINLSSSKKLNDRINSVFSEDQIFRIDHYLAKDSVQKLSFLKLNNQDFFHILNNKLVERTELIFNESIGVGNRLDSYDKVGAIKDMVQSHILQVLSILLMESPRKDTAEDIHNEKVKVLKKIKFVESKDNLLGQYKSYLDEAKQYGILISETETFAKLHLKCFSEKWKNVDILLRTGKQLKKRYGEIRIHFKKLENEATIGISGSILVIGINPDYSIKIITNSGGLDKQSKNLSFLNKDYIRDKVDDEYALLILKVLLNDRTLFTRFDELQECWRIVDEIEKSKNKIKFLIYENGREPDRECATLSGVNNAVA